jgi:hypothetical protein
LDDPHSLCRCCCESWQRVWRLPDQSPGLCDEVPLEAGELLVLAMTE